MDSQVLDSQDQGQKAPSGEVSPSGEGCSDHRSEREAALSSAVEVLDAAHECATEERSACPPAELGSCIGGARTSWQKQQEWPVAPRAARAAGASRASRKVEAGVEAQEAGEARAQET
jgi:hypothetical protein